MKASIVDFLYINPHHCRLTLDIFSDIRDLYEKVRHGEIDIKIKKFFKHRSLDANAYMWVLIDKLSVATATPCRDIYFDQLKNVGGNMEQYCSVPGAIDKLCELWKQEGHTGWGWPFERYPSKIDGCENVKLWYGSSTFDTATMSRLLSNLVQDCKACGIETLPPDELKSLLEGK